MVEIICAKQNCRNSQRDLNFEKKVIIEHNSLHFITFYHHHELFILTYTIVYTQGIVQCNSVRLFSPEMRFIQSFTCSFMLIHFW